MQERKHKTRIAIRTSNNARSDKVWKWMNICTCNCWIEWKHVWCTFTPYTVWLTHCFNNWFTLKVWFSYLVYFMDWLPQFDITKSFNITAQGTGVAMLSVSIHVHTHDVFTSMLFCCSRAPVLSSQVFSVYYALPEEKDYDCNMFDPQCADGERFCR